jgi:hypothetical protein
MQLHVHAPEQQRVVGWVALRLDEPVVEVPADCAKSVVREREHRSEPV